jgi:hypothetical protein
MAVTAAAVCAAVVLVGGCGSETQPVSRVVPTTQPTTQLGELELAPTGPTATTATGELKAKSPKAAERAEREEHGDLTQISPP